MPTGTLILGDQLFPLRGQIGPEHPVFMLEGTELACHIRYHQKKLSFCSPDGAGGFTVECQALGQGPATLFGGADRLEPVRSERIFAAV